MMNRHLVNPAIDWRIQWLGVVPTLFFLVHFGFHWKSGTPGNGLWMCNASSAALGIGMMCRIPILIRVATIWLIPGLPLWIYDATRYGMGPATTILEHVGGVVVGLYALHHIRAYRWMWLHGIGWFLLIQQAGRWLTDPKLNVNTAHFPHASVAKSFPVYWQYWLASMGVVVISMWLLSWALNRIFPERSVPPA